MYALKNKLFKKIIIGFWAICWTIILWIDGLSALEHLGLIHASWAADQYTFFSSLLNQYNTASWFPAVIYICLTLWILMIVIAFLAASFATLTSDIRRRRWAEATFIFSISLWLVLSLALIK